MNFTVNLVHALLKMSQAKIYIRFLVFYSSLAVS